MVRLGLLLTLALILATCTFPQDPNSTLDRVRGGTLRVGVTEHRPWVQRLDGDEPAGVEVELVRHFAEELGTSVQWVWGAEQEHLEALERYELDLAIMGLTQATPWKTRVGLTQPYYTSRITVGVPASMSSPPELAGVAVAVKEGSVIAAYLEEEEARPMRVSEPAQAEALVAAATWELDRLGLTPTDFELHSEKHVMAVPPGENGWLVALEKFLAARQSQVEQALQQQASP